MNDAKLAEALRLADLCNRDGYMSNIERRQIEEELRRLHAENKALKEALAAHEAEQAEEVQPVAYRISDPDEPEIGYWFGEEDITEHGYKCEPLYTRPAQPLTDEQIMDLPSVGINDGSMAFLLRFARAAYRAAQKLAANPVLSQEVQQ